MIGALSLIATLFVMGWLSPRDRNDPVMPPFRVPLPDYPAFGPMPLERSSAWHNLLTDQQPPQPRRRSRLVRRRLRVTSNQ